jgi:hypothetical protein
MKNIPILMLYKAFERMGRSQKKWTLILFWSDRVVRFPIAQKKAVGNRLTRHSEERKNKLQDDVSRLLVSCQLSNDG